MVSVDAKHHVYLLASATLHRCFQSQFENETLVESIQRRKYGLAKLPEVAILANRFRARRCACDHGLGKPLVGSVCPTACDLCLGLQHAVSLFCLQIVMGGWLVQLLSFFTCVKGASLHITFSDRAVLPRPPTSPPLRLFL